MGPLPAQTIPSNDSFSFGPSRMGSGRDLKSGLGGLETQSLLSGSDLDLAIDQKESAELQQQIREMESRMQQNKLKITQLQEKEGSMAKQLQRVEEELERDMANRMKKEEEMGRERDAVILDRNRDRERAVKREQERQGELGQFKEKWERLDLERQSWDSQKREYESETERMRAFEKEIIAECEQIRNDRIRERRDLETFRLEQLQQEKEMREDHRGKIAQLELEAAQKRDEASRRFDNIMRDLIKQVEALQSEVGMLNGKIEEEIRARRQLEALRSKDSSAPVFFVACALQRMNDYRLTRDSYRKWREWVNENLGRSKRNKVAESLGTVLDSYGDLVK